jgi:D-alanine-D-alanine ligase
MNIAVLYNTPSDRFLKNSKNIEAEDDTRASAVEVCEALYQRGWSAHLVAVNEHTIEHAVQSIRADLIFNLIEWTGIDTPYAKQTFAQLDSRGLFYTGATWDSYYLSCDKIALKKELDKHHFPNARWQAFKTGVEPIRNDFHFPVIVKVSLEHSSVGLTKEAVFHNIDGLQVFIQKRIADFKQPVFVEEFLTGREFQVTLIEQSTGLTVLPPAEIVYTKNTDIPLLTYESRWDEKSIDYDNSIVRVAQLAKPFRKQLECLSKEAFVKMGFRDYARFDIRCNGNSPLFLELNANPGLGDDDEYGMTLSYKAVGMRFDDFIEQIVQAALRRKGV